jgi:hypothetical protein
LEKYFKYVHLCHESNPYVEKKCLAHCVCEKADADKVLDIISKLSTDKAKKIESAEIEGKVSVFSKAKIVRDELANHIKAVK